MKNYVKTYHDFFGYSIADWIPCECGCGRQSVDIHHLTPKSRDKAAINKIENLVAVSRECHERADRDRDFNDVLRAIHRRNVLKNGNQKADIVSYNIEKI
jgi:5-methylcytosine-specific restriction endonuclease McrA